jgi:diguanylate cyclase (GGDEF)-like protein
MASTKQKTVRLFTLAQFGIIFLFTMLTIFSLIRLSDVRALLLSLNDNTMPVITQTSQLNNQIQSLATLTNLLSSSSANPEQYLAKEKIDQLISKININLMRGSAEKEYLIKQMNSVYDEIEELDALVAKKLAHETALKANFERFYNIVFTLFTEIKPDHDDDETSNSLFKILLLAIQIDQQTRLHKIRQIEQDLNNQLRITQDSIIPSEKNLQSKMEMLRRLSIGTDGLVNQKVESLRLEGRSRGRDSFVRNLITDVASKLESQSEIINDALATQASNAARSVSKQITLAIWAGVIAVVITLGIIYFLYQRIVVRLLLLASQVNRAAKDTSSRVHIKGNDEIANLANTFSIYLNTVKEQEKALLDLAHTDPLTGIPNRRSFNEQITKMIAQAQRHNWELTILLVDIDFFKSYNDHYGHSDGDVCLRIVANQLNSIVSRTTDFCARYGGEEFICLLPNTNASGARIKAEALRQGIEKMQIPHEQNKINGVVTVSIGVATFGYSINKKWSADIIVEQADKALYQAKAEGRNCCRYFSISG